MSPAFCQKAKIANFFYLSISLITEITDNTEVKAIHVVGFATAFIGAPVLLVGTLAGLLFVLDRFYGSIDFPDAITALGVLSTIGTTLYALIGGPVLIIHLRRHDAEVGRIVALSVLSVLAMLPIGALFSLIMFDLDALMITGIFTCFDLIGGPPLAAIFTLIYQRFDRS